MARAASWSRSASSFALESPALVPAVAAKLKKLGAELTVLTEEQCRYIGVDIGGPYKPDYYRY